MKEKLACDFEVFQLTQIPFGLVNQNLTDDDGLTVNVEPKLQSCSCTGSVGKFVEWLIYSVNRFCSPLFIWSDNLCFFFTFSFIYLILMIHIWHIGCNCSFVRRNFIQPRKQRCLDWRSTGTHLPSASPVLFSVSFIAEGAFVDDRTFLRAIGFVKNDSRSSIVLSLLWDELEVIDDEHAFLLKVWRDAPWKETWEILPRLAAVVIVSCSPENQIDDFLL